MVQNHLFQILSIVAMEWPEQFSTTAMHDAQLRVLRALRPVEDVRDSLVLGQYKGYRQENPFLQILLQKLMLHFVYLLTMNVGGILRFISAQVKTSLS